MTDSSPTPRPAASTVKALEVTFVTRLLTILNLGVTVLLLLGVIVMVNVIAHEHQGRMNWTRDQVEELSPDTVARLRSVRRDVEIFVTPFLLGEYEFDQSLPEAWRLTIELLREFERRNPNVRLTLAREGTPPPPWLADFGPRVAPNAVYLYGRDADQKVQKRVLRIEELYTGDRLTGEIHDFRAEVRLISAVYTMAVARRKVVYYTYGHGEQLVEDGSPQGLSEVARSLEHRDNVQFKPLNLETDRTVPPDADAVLVPGPRRDFPEPHLDALRQYLKEAGRLFVALEAGSYENTPRFNQFLAAWGVRRGKGIVFDPLSHRHDRFWWVRAATFEPSHVINQDVSVGQIFLPKTTTVTSAPPPDGGLRVVTLLATSPEAWEDHDGQGRPDPDEPHAGPEKPLPLVAAVEGEAVKSPRFGERPAPKLVVWGSIYALTNENFMAMGGFDYREMQYALNNFRWLLEMEQVITPPQKRGLNRRSPVDLGRGGRMQIGIIGVGVIPGLGVVLGILAWLFRRK